MMTQADKSAVYFLICSIESNAAALAKSIRAIDAARQTAQLENETELFLFLAAMNINGAIDATLVNLQRSEQLVAKLRDVLEMELTL